jgi:hypothetical protein
MPPLPWKSVKRSFLKLKDPNKKTVLLKIGLVVKILKRVMDSSIW